MTARRRRPGTSLVGAATVCTSLLFAACGGGTGAAGGGGPVPTGGATATTADLAARVEQFPVAGRNHVTGPVQYPQTPPVGGDHNPAWMNCGFYSQPVPAEAAVHSLEHGAVWLAFRPNVARQEIDAIRSLTRTSDYVLAAPWPDDSLPAPIVATAWGLQLRAQSAADPALAAFVRTYADGPQTPEKGARCSGAFGTPE